MKAKTPQNKEIRKITLGLALSWIFGVLFLISGLSWVSLGSFTTGIFLILASLIILPSFNKIIREKLKLEISTGLKIILVLTVIILAIYFRDGTPNKISTSNSVVPQSINFINEPFRKYSNVFCNKVVTSLHKQTIFDNDLKNRYVIWTGKVSSISQSFGNYILQVKHCPSTLTSDVQIVMYENQRDKLLGYKENDIITYKARLVRLGDILGIYADNGEIVELDIAEANKVKEELKSPIDKVMSILEETKSVDNNAEKTGEPIIVTDTKKGITFSLNKITYKTDNIGVLIEGLTFTIKNNRSDSIPPYILIYFYKEDDSNILKSDVREQIDGGWYIQPNETKIVDAKVHLRKELDDTKILRSVLVDSFYSPRALVVLETKINMSK